MKAILTDVTRCIGCELCVAKCKEINKLGVDRPWPWLSPDRLSAARWTTVITRPGSRYVRKHCQHCLDPACVAACPVAALRRTPEGAVIYDVSVCLGCRYCMNACPFGIPRYNWESARPAIQKCNLCHPRILEGKKPGCVEVCPTEATIFGDREELLAEARRRLQAEPDRYIHKIWGEHEVGGTSVLYLCEHRSWLSRLERGPGKPSPPAAHLEHPHENARRFPGDRRTHGRHLLAGRAEK